MSIRSALRNPPTRAKVMGSIFITIGIYLIIFHSETIYINIGFGAIFIGLFAFIVITEKTIPKKLNDAQLLSSMELLYSLTDNLELKGNGLYIPAGGNLTKERVFIPLQEEEKYDLPSLDDDTVFVTGTSGSSLGVVFVPPGLGLLDLYEKEMGVKIENIDIDELEQNLQIMIYGLGLIKDLFIKREENEFIRLKITHSAYKDICEEIARNKGIICKQTGCPICSSILCALTRSLDKKVRIRQVDIKDNIISFKLRIGG
ncbi:MAG: hypothetical protein ACFFDN_28875 [Candidatus Hodarchaeota archaeon]